MQIYKSLKKKQSLFKKLLSLYWVAFIPPTAKLMSGLSLPLCKAKKEKKMTQATFDFTGEQ